jgi:hypothetical protein
VRSVAANERVAADVNAKANDPSESQDVSPESQDMSPESQDVSHERPVDVNAALAMTDVLQGARSAGAEEEEAQMMDARGLGIRWIRARAMETRNVDARHFALVAIFFPFKDRQILSIVSSIDNFGIAWYGV